MSLLETHNYGWTVKTTAYIEEEDQGGGCSDNDYGYSDDYGGEDYDEDYDIDNNGDFWRRAGD